MSLVSIRDVRKSFGQNEVLKGVSLDIAKGDVVAIIGRSGSGKSTLLRCINGLETYQSGSITADGIEVGGLATNLRELLTTHRETLTELSKQAAALLSQSGHQPSPDVMRRVTMTLEGLAAQGLLDGAPSAGRLTADVDPPGFETISALAPRAAGDKPAREAGDSRVLAFRANQRVAANGRGKHKGAATRADDAARDADLMRHRRRPVGLDDEQQHRQNEQEDDALAQRVETRQQQEIEQEADEHGDEEELERHLRNLPITRSNRMLIAFSDDCPFVIEYSV